jgi:hypothetical protein
MNKKIITFCILTFLFASEFVMYAQPGDDDGSGTLEGNDPAPAPIDSKLILLVIAGICFAFYVFKRNKKEA